MVVLYAESFATAAGMVVLYAESFATAAEMVVLYAESFATAAEMVVLYAESFAPAAEMVVLYAESFAPVAEMVVSSLVGLNGLCMQGKGVTECRSFAAGHQGAEVLLAAGLFFCLAQHALFSAVAAVPPELL